MVSSVLHSELGALGHFRAQAHPNLGQDLPLRGTPCYVPLTCARCLSLFTSLLHASHTRQFAPVFAFPIFFMVLWDFPRDRPILYQIILTIATWQYAIYQVLYIFLCGYYGNSHAIPTPVIWCGTKDFLPTF